MENNIKLELNVNQLNVILTGLAKLPLEMSLETFTYVRQQADAQVNTNKPEGPLSNKVLN
jgi:hypothetical protein